MIRSHAGCAFTIVELLVVVTIIVVLAALLAPALDRAIYQAELAVCASTQRSLGAAVTQYAMSNGRVYPYRPGKRGSQTAHPRDLNIGFATYADRHVDAGPLDDRPYLTGYVNLNKQMRDAFLPELPLDDPDPTVWIGSCFDLYYGIQYDHERGLFRLGDRLEFTPDLKGGQTDRYDLLTGDFDNIVPTNANGTTWGSHPDVETGILEMHAPTRGFELGVTTTYARWQSIGPNSTFQRGPVDMNFQRTDLSVQRYNAVKWDDDRMAHLPITTDRNAGNHLPANWAHAPQQ